MLDFWLLVNSASSASKAALPASLNSSENNRQPLPAALDLCLLPARPPSYSSHSFPLAAPFFFLLFSPTTQARSIGLFLERPCLVYLPGLVVLRHWRHPHSPLGTGISPAIVDKNFEQHGPAHLDSGGPPASTFGITRFLCRLLRFPIGPVVKTFFSGLPLQVRLVQCPSRSAQWIPLSPPACFPRKL